MDSISLSAMMAECYALSMAMREVLPFKDLMFAIVKACGLGHSLFMKFKTTVWEDNIDFGES